ncbi:MAG: 2-oxoacid:ferredoxin oxidoreductase subunit beta [Deinococcus-Thermus bacterium]|jgi:2-oxoglutarate ferredoxin oxidoreductase subunit beta|nr:2-oxoacid:ferredoxin oxidoreductase subunit beta [Deinococcota bacterium]
MTRPSALVPNALGLTKSDYGGRPSTLCKGCGHNAVANQIVQVAFELGLAPDEIVKLSGIGCSSKSPAYFLGMSHGFNALHGRMPSMATGALTANRGLRAIGVSGDGDTGSIGLGQFKHLMRRNVRMVYLVENNGVYGLTKGQFSPTAEDGLTLKYAGTNPFPPVELCSEALLSGCGFVARGFAGDAKQLRELLKAALAHRGTAVIDIVSPCVAFNNDDDSQHSYSYGRQNEVALQELGWIAPREDIVVDDHEPGETRVVELHDGSRIALAKLEEGYDPSDRGTALARLQTAEARGEVLTGLIYIDDSRPSLPEAIDLTDTPLVDLPEDALRPPPEALEAVLDRY